MAYVADTGATICGRYPVAVLLAMLPDGASPHLLKYDTSGAIGGDYTNSVSYLTVAFSGAWSSAPKVAAPAPERELDAETRHRLLKLARDTLTYAVEHKRTPTLDDLGATVTPPMEEIKGVFVTLHKEGRLRGCIGEIVASRPLYKAVMARAVSAGLEDYRFQPVEADELPDLHFEISVLSQPVPVDSPDDIIIGKHGVILEKNRRRAVFLPQVAPEQGWGLEEMLSHLSSKAGLPQDAWREGTTFRVFEATVFAEDGA